MVLEPCRNLQRGDVCLGVVDSLWGTSQGNDRDAEIGLTTKWLAQQARDTGKPILLSHHLRKRGMFDLDEITLDRVRGSSTIVQTARLVWALDAPHPDAPERKRLSVIKPNLAAFP